MFGEWLKSFYSCEGSSYDHFVASNKKTLKNTQSLLKFPTEGGRELAQHHMAQSSMNLSGDRSSHPTGTTPSTSASRMHRSKSNFPVSGNVDETGEIELKNFLKETSTVQTTTSNQMFHPALKDLNELWCAYPQPPYEEEVCHFIIWIIFFSFEFKKLWLSPKDFKVFRELLLAEINTRRVMGFYWRHFRFCWSY